MLSCQAQISRSVILLSDDVRGACRWLSYIAYLSPCEGVRSGQLFVSGRQCALISLEFQWARPKTAVRTNVSGEGPQTTGSIAAKRETGPPDSRAL